MAPLYQIMIQVMNRNFCLQCYFSLLKILLHQSKERTSYRNWFHSEILRTKKQPIFSVWTKPVYFIRFFIARCNSRIRYDSKDSVSYSLEFCESFKSDVWKLGKIKKSWKEKIEIELCIIQDSSVPTLLFSSNSHITVSLSILRISVLNASN